MNMEIDKHYVIRSIAGVFVCEIEEIDHENRFATVKNARRIYYWEGAASLSQLAIEGVKKPETCKFPREIPTQMIYEIIELIPMTEEAVKSIDNVPIWKI